MALIPVTILTGFLGSGKTTLLKRVLTEAHGQKIAVIENEFGEENIDNDILVTESKEQIVQMSNGCICCTIREDLRETLQLLEPGACCSPSRARAASVLICSTRSWHPPGPMRGWMATSPNAWGAHLTTR